ncbi:MAG TPA: Gfo/Idh/MocA family oxidoreductase [Abditibacteriaceae bacterium]|jgi:predicted dehydrogenase
MSKRIGIGVVGAGSIGIRGALEHLSLPDVQDRLELVAVCDPVAGRAAAAAKKYGVRRAYESYEELLADADVDALTMATPIGLHYEQGLAAVRSGKHIHFNKTMTTRAEEAQQLIEEASTRGVKIVASPGQMTRQTNRAIRKAIMDGALGQLVWSAVGAAFGEYHEKESVRTGDDVLSNVNPSWYWRKPGGGPVYDMTVYGLHTLTGILGPAKRVTAMSGIVVPQRSFRGETYAVDMDDNTLMTLDFGNSQFSFVYGTAAGSLVKEFGKPTFFGTKGQIVGTQLNGEPLPELAQPQLAADGQPVHMYGPHITGAHREMGESHVFEDIMQLVDYVRDDVAPYGTAEHACHVIEIIEAAYRAAETGQTQTLSTTFKPVDVN